MFCRKQGQVLGKVGPGRKHICKFLHVAYTACTFSMIFDSNVTGLKKKLREEEEKA
jgi:hypothetical protein